jgi:uncharacterized transporter YbjL
MSLTATVDPYESPREEDIEAERQQTRAEAEARQQRHRAERLSGYAKRFAGDELNAEKRVRVPLRFRHPEVLLDSAKRLGYRLAPLSIPANGEVLLQRGSKTLRIRRGTNGTEVISSEGRDAVQELVREHVLGQAIEHLRRRNMEVSIRRMPNNEIEIVGNEKVPGPQADRAKVTAAVDRNGRIAIDVEGTQGHRCESLVLELARSIEGEVTTTKKAEYFLRTRTANEERVRG